MVIYFIKMVEEFGSKSNRNNMHFYVKRAFCLFVYTLMLSFSNSKIIKNTLTVPGNKQQAMILKLIHPQH